MTKQLDILAELSDGTPSTVQAIKDAGEDFEWYPTTPAMIEAVRSRLMLRHRDDRPTCSILDIGAGDGRVLLALDSCGKMYGIERSAVLQGAWPDRIIPAGANLFDQDLTLLQVDVVFCNPPFSQFSEWVSLIVNNAYCLKAFFVIPRRWKNDELIVAALRRRNANADVIFSDTFAEGDRASRAVVDVVRVTFPTADAWERQPEDPFRRWFNENIDTFDRLPDKPADHYSRREEERVEAEKERERLREADSIDELVDLYNKERESLNANYRAIFALDPAILRELGASKDGICEAIKLRLKGLNAKHWGAVLDQLGPVRSRLTSKTREEFSGLIGRGEDLLFSRDNAFNVVGWMLTNANQYFDEQTVAVFRELSDVSGVVNYASNKRTWGSDGWRYLSKDFDHYALDYRFVLSRHAAAGSGWDYEGGLYRACHELIDDVVTVLSNLGFHAYADASSRRRTWTPGQWQDFDSPTEGTLFQVKAFKNGNLHFRFKPEAIRALNVEAGRLLGWLSSPEQAASELGLTIEEAGRFFRGQRYLPTAPSRLLLGFDGQQAAA